ncbi:hypothetical protein ACEWJZ_29125, partial [Escherichia coli]
RQAAVVPETRFFFEMHIGLIQRGMVVSVSEFCYFLYAQLLMVNNIKKISKFLTLPLFSRGVFLSGTP